MVGVQDEDQFLTSQERQSIVRHLLFSIRIIQNKEINGIKFKVNQSLSNFRKFSNEILFFLFWYTLVQRGLEKKLIRQVLPLHNKETLNHLRQTWVWPQSFFKPQPIGK